MKPSGQPMEIHVEIVFELATMCHLPPPRLVGHQSRSRLPDLPQLQLSLCPLPPSNNKAENKINILLIVWLHLVVLKGKWANIPFA